MAVDFSFREPLALKYRTLVVNHKWKNPDEAIRLDQRKFLEDKRPS